MTWHAQLNCQRSTPPDGKSGPLNRGDSNDDRTSSSPNRSVGIYPTGQLLRLRLHLAFVKSFSEFFFCGPSAARLEGLWSAGRRCSQLRHDHPGHNPERADAPLHRPTAVWGCAVPSNYSGLWPLPPIYQKQQELLLLFLERPLVKSNRNDFRSGNRIGSPVGSLNEANWAGFQIAATPEPSSMLLFLTGALGLLVVIRRRLVA